MCACVFECVRGRFLSMYILGLLQRSHSKLCYTLDMKDLVLLSAFQSQFLWSCTLENLVMDYGLGFNQSL